MFQTNADGQGDPGHRVRTEISSTPGAGTKVQVVIPG
jgi:hypothetical protein